MSEKLPLPAYTKGIVREVVVDSPLSPPDSVELSLNLHGDTIGAFKLRKGMTLLGANITASPVLGIGNYRNNAGTTYKALAKVGTAVYDYGGSSWASIRTSLVAASKMRFTNFVDHTFMVNGSGASGDAIKTYDGTAVGITNVASLPKGDVIENYRSRIWVGDASTDKLYYSDVVTTSNTITGGTAFIQISPQDGEKMRALKRTSRALLVFKENHIYRVFNINSTDPDPTINRGTYSQESVIESKTGIHYHHPTGFYDYVDGAEQREISRPIIDIIQAIPRSYYENVSGWVDDDHLYWSVGDITVGGITFANVICARTQSTQVWTVYSTGSEIRSAGDYDDGTTIHKLVGDDVGNVLKWGVGNTDNGTPIFYDLQTHWMYFSQVRTTTKSFTELATIHENAQGGNLSYQIDTDSPNKWGPIGELKKNLIQIDPLNAKDFIRIRFRFSGSSVGSPFLFRGWELLNLLIVGEPKKI